MQRLHLKCEVCRPAICECRFNSCLKFGPLWGLLWALGESPNRRCVPPAEGLCGSKVAAGGRSHAANTMPCFFLLIILTFPCPAPFARETSASQAWGEHF